MTKALNGTPGLAPRHLRSDEDKPGQAAAAPAAPSVVFNAELSAARDRELAEQTRAMRVRIQGATGKKPSRARPLAAAAAVVCLLVGAGAVFPHAFAGVLPDFSTSN